jgi:hypothetical protein
MEEQASLLLCNLASIHGLAKAREMLNANKPAESVAKPEPAPEVRPDVDSEPVVSIIPQRTPEQQAQRDAEDEGAKSATVAQLREALEGLSIQYPKNASRSALLTLWLNRP